MKKNPDSGLLLLLLLIGGAVALFYSGVWLGWALPLTPEEQAATKELQNMQGLHKRS